MRGFFGVFVYTRRALSLVWATNRALCISLAVLTTLAGIFPAAIAAMGGRIIDALVAALQSGGAARATLIERTLWLVVYEGLLVGGLAAIQRGIAFCQSLAKAQLAQRINLMILEKAQQLELAQFESPDLYDKLARARNEASTRPISLVTRAFALTQNFVMLFGFGVLLIKFSPWAVLALIVGALPQFLAETKFAGDAFRLFVWRSPLGRMQMYLGTVLSREDHAKEVKLFGLGPLFIDRYRRNAQSLYEQERKLTVRRDAFGLGFGLLSTIALYGTYTWIVLATLAERITLGTMTMYMVFFRQGQHAISSILGAISGMYEDNLYLMTLYEYLETPTRPRLGTLTAGVKLGDGIRFENVSFAYPGTQRAVLQDVSLHLRPGESLALVGTNGSGKTTLIKLLTRLYQPTAGRIYLDGQDLCEWDAATLNERIGVIFQDFTRYQLTLGENIGAGDVEHFQDESRWQAACEKGMAEVIVDRLGQGYRTQLGKWFAGGQELSGGEWQKVALSRAFMRSRADILVLDEPTAAMDAAAEASIFERFRQMTRDRIAILVSHRFSTVRMADQILVLQDGRIAERGSHDALMQQAGYYAQLFALQAKGYR